MKLLNKKIYRDVASDLRDLVWVYSQKKPMHITRRSLYNPIHNQVWILFGYIHFYPENT